MEHELPYRAYEYGFILVSKYHCQFVDCFPPSAHGGGYLYVGDCQAILNHLDEFEKRIDQIGSMATKLAGETDRFGVTQATDPICTICVCHRRLKCLHRRLPSHQQRQTASNTE